jgi:hypothetical protein
MMDEDKRKALEEKYWAVLSNFFGPSPLAIIEPLEKAAKEVEALNANLTAFNRALEASSEASRKVATALNWITGSLVGVALLTLGWDIWKWFHTQ